MARMAKALRQRIVAPRFVAKGLKACECFFTAWGIALCTAAILVACVLLVAQRLTVSRLRHEAETLRQDNAQLRQALLSTKNALALFERKANELYPDLNTPEAMARLVSELEEMSRLSLRTVFRSLNADLHRELVSRLRGVGERYQGLSPTVLVKFQQGDGNLDRVANELVKLLELTGIEADMTPTTATSTDRQLASVVLICQRDTVPFAEGLMKALTPLFSTPMTGQIQHGMPTGKLHLQFYGTPQFLRNGTIRFE